MSGHRPFDELAAAIDNDPARAARVAEYGRLIDAELEAAERGDGADDE